MIEVRAFKKGMLTVYWAKTLIQAQALKETLERHFFTVTVRQTA